MGNTMEIIKANDSLDRLYNMADIVNHKETQRVIEALDQPSPLDGFFGGTMDQEIRAELARIIQAHALLGQLTRDGAVALRDLLAKTNSTVTVTPQYCGYLAEDERIIRDYDIDQLWRTLHGEELGSGSIDGLFVPYYGDDMP